MTAPEDMPVIEKGVQIPKRNGARRLKVISATAEKLEPGDSFYVKSNKNLGSGLFYIRRKYPDRIYVTRREGDGHRVWRKV